VYNKKEAKKKDLFENEILILIILLKNNCLDVNK
jgi:hypothetical protein